MFNLNINDLRFALKNSVPAPKEIPFLSAVCITYCDGECSVVSTDMKTFAFIDVACSGGKEREDFIVNRDALLGFLGKSKGFVSFADSPNGVTVKIDETCMELPIHSVSDFPDYPEMSANSVQNSYLPMHFHDAVEYCKTATNCKDKGRAVLGCIKADTDCFVSTDSYRVHQYTFPKGGKEEITIPPELWKSHKVFRDKNELIYLSQDENFVSIEQGGNFIITKRCDLTFPNWRAFVMPNKSVNGAAQFNTSDLVEMADRCASRLCYKDGSFFEALSLETGEKAWSCASPQTWHEGTISPFCVDKKYLKNALAKFDGVVMSNRDYFKPILLEELRDGDKGPRMAIVMPVRADFLNKTEEKPEEPVSEPAEPVEVEEPVEVRSEEPEQVEEPVTAEPEPEPAPEPEEIGSDEPQEIPAELQAEIDSLRAEYENKVAVLENAFNKMAQKFRYAVDLGAMPHEELPEVCDHHEGLDCCINGTWVWIWGDTKPFAGELKKNGFFWHNKRQMWFWNESFPQFVKEAFAA